MQRKLVIFDFDGTLADTFELFLRGFDEAADLYQFSRFDRANLSYVRSLDARGILQHHHVPMWKLPLVMQKLRRIAAQQIATVELFPAISESIEELHSCGATLALLTSNAKANVTKVLGRELFQRFAFVESGISLFGKRSSLKRLLAKSGHTADEAIYIGDELRDLQAAQQCSVAFGAVAWGYTNLEALVNAGCHQSFAEPRELASLLCPANL